MRNDIKGIVKSIEDLLFKLGEPEFTELAMGLQVVLLNTISNDNRLTFLKDAMKIVNKAERMKRVQDGTKEIMRRVTKEVIDDTKKGYVGQEEIPFILKERLKSEGVTSKIHMEIHQFKKGKKSIKVVDTDEGN